LSFINSQDGNDDQVDQVSLPGCLVMRSKRAITIVSNGLRIANHFEIMVKRLNTCKIVLKTRLTSAALSAAWTHKEGA
jgi:hypothetical protein